MTTTHKKPNKLYPFKQQISDICTTLLNEHIIQQKECDMITGIQNFGARTGHITFKQITQVGRLSKQYIQNGKYIEHDWWD